jgi:hypothetical protein
MPKNRKVCRKPPRGPWIKTWFKDLSDKYYPDCLGRVYLLDDGQVQFRDYYRRLWPTERVEGGWRFFERRDDDGAFHRVLLREEDWQRLLEKAQCAT